jgi:hypothetical protein
MTCTCPKCHARIELDLPDVTEAGTSAQCPACNARFNIFRESFGGRALRKSSEISCAPCGSELGPETHCPTCGAQFPDYLVASIGRKRARRDSKKLKLKTSPFPKSKTVINHLPTLEMSMRADAPGSPGAAASISKTPRTLILAVSLVVAIALAVAGTMLFLKSKEEKNYTRNFVLATYCIQSGVDKAFKTSTKMSTEWKQKMDAGQSYNARQSVEDEKGFGLVNSKLDQAMGRLAKPPQKFASCNEKLAKLQAVYSKLGSLLLTPGNSMPAFVDATSKLDGEYKQAVKEFKSGLPTEVMEELASASLKFKSLRPLLH